jgi:hypothetical protein
MRHSGRKLVIVALVYSSTTASLGTAGIATVQIGNETAKQAGAVGADNTTARV